MNLQSLREKANAATPGKWTASDPDTNHYEVIERHGGWVARCECQEDTDFIVAANPKTVLALLDALEIAKSFIEGYSYCDCLSPYSNDANHKHEHDCMVTGRQEALSRIEELLGEK